MIIPFLQAGAFVHLNWVQFGSLRLKHEFVILQLSQLSFVHNKPWKICMVLYDSSTKMKVWLQICIQVRHTHFRLSLFSNNFGLK